MTDYLEKYDLNLEYLQGNKHEEYKTALLEYYSTDNVCPKSGEEVKKELKDGILKISCSKSKYNLRITLAKYVDLYEDLENKKKNRNVILSKISMLLMKDDLSGLKSDFEKLKEDYVNNKKEINSINKVFDKQQDNIEEHNRVINLLRSELSSVFQKRKGYYSKIKNYKLDNTQKESIMNYLKQHSSNINSKTLAHLNKFVKIDSDDMKNWIEWMRKCVKYLMVKHKLRKEVNKFKIYEKHIETINKHFIIDMPVIDNHKDIDVPQKGGATIFDNPSPDNKTPITNQEYIDETHISNQEHVVSKELPSDIKTIHLPNSVQQSVQEPVQQPVQEQVQQSVQEQVQEQIQEPVQQSVKEQVQQQVQEPIQQPIQQIKQPMPPPIVNQPPSILSTIKNLIPFQGGGSKNDIKQIHIDTKDLQQNIDQPSSDIKIVRIKKEHLTPSYSEST